jgi:hypothetical protein
MKDNRLNDHEREQWINNDEGLYDWWQRSRCSMRQFIRENREELDSLILAALSQQPVR